MPKAKHAVVTGGGRGIGAAAARIFKSRGFRVTIMGRNRGEIEPLADEIGCYAVRVDVGDPASVEAAFMAAGPVDVLVNNAGIIRTSLVTKTDVRVWEEHLKINVTGAFLCCLKVLPGMISRKSGRIINVASQAGLEGMPYMAAYCASKHGLVGFTKALATEVGVHGIHVNAICPGPVDTTLLNQAVEMNAEKTGKSTESIIAVLAARNASGKLLTPQEVAEKISWMSTEEADDLNGQTVSL